MTFYRGLCEDLFDTLGRDASLRHAYGVCLWQRALGLVHHSPSKIAPAVGVELYWEVQALRWSKMSNELDAERSRRM